MPKNKEYFIELILKKLNNNNLRKVNLEKEEFTKFIDSLINYN